MQCEVEQPPRHRLGGGLGVPGHRVPATDHVPGVLHRRRCPRVRCPTVRHHHRLPEDGHQALVGRDPRPGGPQQGRQDPQEQEAGPAHDAHRGGGVLAVLGSMAGLKWNTNNICYCQVQDQFPFMTKDRAKSRIIRYNCP